MPIPFFLVWLLLVNAAAFTLFGVDKAKAKRDAWRIPEKALFAAALLGGSVGAIAGMKLFRHKTRHRSFTLGLPLILVLQVGALLYIHFTGGLF